MIPAVRTQGFPPAHLPSTSSPHLGLSEGAMIQRYRQSSTQTRVVMRGRPICSLADSLGRMQECSVSIASTPTVEVLMQSAPGAERLVLLKANLLDEPHSGNLLRMTPVEIWIDSLELV